MSTVARQRTGSAGLWRFDAGSSSATADDHLFRRKPARWSVGRLLLAVALVAAVVLGGWNITNEGAVSTQGDMPRHLMNGVFLYDLLTDGDIWRTGDIIGEAQRYFARYPALSIGHHPPLLPASLIPFYAVFGISVFSARLAILVWFVVAIVSLYSLTRRLYGRDVAGWASLLLSTNPFVVLFGQHVMSEMPMIALVLLTLDILLRFCDSGRPRDFVFFVVAAIASLFAKQLAIFMVPVYVLVLVTQAPRAYLLQRSIVVMMTAGGVLAVPVVVMTLMLSPFNVEAVRYISTQAMETMSLTHVWSVLSPSVGAQLTPIVAVCSITAAVMAAVRRDRRVMLSLAWISTVLAAVVFVTASLEPDRYSIVAVPGYVILVASLASTARSGFAYWGVTCLLVASVGSQVWAARAVRPTGAEGYEAAARFVLSQDDSPTVLYSASVDTGYFVFFVRKHDPAQRLIVMRADKLLTTSLMADLSVENRIERPDDIYPLLQTYGTRFVVIEDRPSGSVVLNWLRDELRTERFAERQRIPIISQDYRLRGNSIAIYEYLDARPPSSDAAIDMRLPLVGRQFHVPLSELLPPDRR